MSNERLYEFISGFRGEGISREDREWRGDCSEVHLIVKIIGRGEFFYDVVRRRAELERSGTIPHVLAFPDFVGKRCGSCADIPSFLCEYASVIVHSVIKLHFSTTFLYLRVPPHIDICMCAYLNLDIFSMRRERGNRNSIMEITSLH